MCSVTDAPAGAVDGDQGASGSGNASNAKDSSEQPTKGKHKRKEE
jgi:hypothetical protein